MAKFELSVYGKDGETVKTAKRDFVPIDLFIRCQQLAEKISEGKFETDEALFDALVETFAEIYPALTKDEIRNGIDLADMLYSLNDIVGRAAKFEGNSKSKNA